MNIFSFDLKNILNAKYFYDEVDDFDDDDDGKSRILYNIESNHYFIIFIKNYILFF